MCYHMLVGGCLHVFNTACFNSYMAECTHILCVAYNWFHYDSQQGNRRTLCRRNKIMMKAARFYSAKYHIVNSESSVLTELFFCGYRST